MNISSSSRPPKVEFLESKPDLVEEAKEKSKKEPGTIYRVRGPPGDRKIVKITTKEEVIPSQAVQMLAPTLQ